ncbi:hypothetical protein Ancab_032923 [Ancistrocladus abbreviatus]
MEGLIKGLIDLAIGGGGGDNNEMERERDHEEREERSRSTWAQVVSGDGEQDDADPPNQGDSRRQDHHNQNQWNKMEHSYGGSDQESRISEWRPSHSPQMDGQEEHADGWQTVHKKPLRGPQKVHMDHWHKYKHHPSEQEYSEEVQDNGQLEPSEEELVDLSQACNKLWELDFNRLVPGKDYEIDCGEGKKPYNKEDMAAGNLFTWLGDDVLPRPTFSRFCSLLDNYNPIQGYKEEVTNEEKQEQVAFVEEISRTAPIKYLCKYLSNKGIISESYDEFKRLMIDLWFGLYGRGGTSGSSSAFEHVFVGEIKQCGEQEVSGFHNWLQFYLEEAKGRVDYQGYILPRRHGEFPDSETQLLTVQFEWNGVLKSVSSTFIGVSPEFEVALYTLCFFAGREDNRIRLGPYHVNVKCYRMGEKIGSIFPIAED